MKQDDIQPQNVDIIPIRDPDIEIHIPDLKSGHFYDPGNFLYIRGIIAEDSKGTSWRIREDSKGLCKSKI